MFEHSADAFEERRVDRARGVRGSRGTLRGSEPALSVFGVGRDVVAEQCERERGRAGDSPGGRAYAISCA